MTESLVIPRRFRGPEASANGGYTCGALAELVGADVVEVTLRKPPPLDLAMTVAREGDVVVLFDGEELVAEARPGTLDLDAAPRVEFPEAQALADARGEDPDHPFPGCFVCGPKSEGLRLRPTPVGDGRLVAPWVVPTEFAEEKFVWAALDCPGGWAVQPDGSRGISVLGRLTAQVFDVPDAGDQCVVVGWPLGPLDTRKREAGAALYRAGTLLALGRAIWFTVDDSARDAAA